MYFYFLVSGWEILGLFAIFCFQQETLGTIINQKNLFWGNIHPPVGVYNVSRIKALEKRG